MQKQSYSPNRDALEKAKNLANSPAGRQLYTLLQNQSGEDLEKAVAQASSGDLNAAQQILNRLMANPEARELLQKLGR